MIIDKSMLCIVILVVHLICNISNKNYFDLLYFYVIFLVNCNNNRTISKKFFTYRLIIFTIFRNARTSIASININYLIIFLIQLSSI